jgi:hypothetical protein
MIVVQSWRDEEFSTRTYKQQCQSMKREYFTETTERATNQLMMLSFSICFSEAAHEKRNKDTTTF